MGNSLKTAITFVILFIVYHCAEYMIVFKNNAVGFFLFQILFFLLAWLFGNWHSDRGLAVWGLLIKTKAFKLFVLGLPMGVLLYGVPFIINLYINVEQIIKIPSFKIIIISSLPFAVGVLFSSLSEDILTRGIIFRQFHSKIKPYGLAILSAVVYLVNHIYRLTDGPDAWCYIFMLGIIFIIPVLVTKNLWFTGAMHWAGNVFFYVTHEVIKTIPGEIQLSANYIFALCLLLMAPIVYWGSKKAVLILN